MPRKYLRGCFYCASALACTTRYCLSTSVRLSVRDVVILYLKNAFIVKLSGLPGPGMGIALVFLSPAAVKTFQGEPLSVDDKCTRCGGKLMNFDRNRRSSRKRYTR